MGQDPGTGRTSVTEQRGPEQLREEIEATRQELGDTVEALAAKTDVKVRAKRKLSETKSSVAEKKDKLLGKARDVSPGNSASTASQVSEKARANARPLAAAGVFLAGFLVGRGSKG